MRSGAAENAGNSSLPGACAKRPPQPAAVEAVAANIEASAGASFVEEADLRRILSREEEHGVGIELLAIRDGISAQLAAVPRLLACSLGRTHAEHLTSFRETVVVDVIRTARAAAMLAQQASGGRSRVSRAASGWFEFGSPAELLSFADDLEVRLAKYRSLRDRMIAANLRLVDALTRRYRRSDVPAADLVQEGTLGLMRAIEKWDPRRDVRFVTYAAHWVRQKIGAAAASHSALIRSPARRTRPHDASAPFAGNGAPPDRAARPDDHVHGGVRLRWLSLDEPSSAEGGHTLGEILAGPGVEAETVVAVAGLPAILARALERLPPREAEVLRLRFGTDAGVPRTLDEVADRLGFPKERVRQIEAKALRRLAPICEKQGLRGYGS